jgi:hypothetical protein
MHLHRYRGLSLYRVPRQRRVRAQGLAQAAAACAGAAAGFSSTFTAWLGRGQSEVPPPPSGPVSCMLRAFGQLTSPPSWDMKRQAASTWFALWQHGGADALELSTGTRDLPSSAMTHSATPSQERTSLRSPKKRPLALSPAEADNVKHTRPLELEFGSAALSFRS